MANWNWKVVRAGMSPWLTFSEFWVAKKTILDGFHHADIKARLLQQNPEAGRDDRFPDTGIRPGYKNTAALQRLACTHITSNVA